MAPTEGRVAKPERRCRRGTPRAQGWQVTLCMIPYGKRHPIVLRWVSI